MERQHRRSVNIFAVLVVLMILVPEGVGHLLFERAHPPNSSVRADVMLAASLHDGSGRSGICHISILSDPSGADVARSAGLEGKYGKFICA